MRFYPIQRCQPPEFVAKFPAFGVDDRFPLPLACKSWFDYVYKKVFRSVLYSFPGEYISTAESKSNSIWLAYL